MARLTDTQLVILSAASQREDRGVELPENVQGKTTGKVVAKLIRAGLLEEVEASGSLPVWRRDDGSGAIALRITSAGLAPIHAAAAAIAGAAAYLFGPQVVFYLLAFMAMASLASVLAIPEAAIDHNLARGLHAAAEKSDAANEHPSGLSVLLTCRPLLIFAICVTLFHLSNAAMLPLVGQKLALQDKHFGTSLMSACITAAQIVMVPMAMLVGAKADQWGHKRFFLAALLILPVRGALYTFSDNKAWLVGVQLLDGIGAGIFGAIFPVIVADLMRNTGRFNVAQGAIITAQGMGAALSTTLAGLVVVKGGYSLAFLVLGAVAGIGFAVCAFALPETRPDAEAISGQLGQTARTGSVIAAE